MTDLTTRTAARPVTRCRTCRADDWQDVVSFGSVPLANGFLDPAAAYPDEPRYPLGVVSCRSCRLLSLTHVVDPEILYRDYAYVTSGSDTMVRHMRGVAETCRRRFGLAPGDFVVEIGSNTGQQLAAFQDTGARVLGVDPARNLAAVADAAGVPTLPEFFSAGTARQVARDFGRADLVLGRHVFAHIDDISGVVSGLRELLTPDGVFAVEVPYALDLVERLEFDTIYHEHLSYFLIRPLCALFERHGMRVFDIERLPVHGGSILVFAGFADGPWPVRPVVSELLRLEESAGLYGDAAYRDFARQVERTRDGLRSLVRGLVAAGERVAGYGASAKGTTLLNICGLGSAELEFCSDTTDLKQGKVLPGTHVPVRSPQAAAQDPPDCYLLLAWNYADEILRKESAFLDSGGTFILPVPEPSIVAA
ncbi:class I SAM-dependent methyltransferase [Actinomadura craniellae]|uniref:Class I SAM-dependent methyltransferase n=1 Tax=Actinomadura craniellae TaxID=2231787 RepID=A0A365H0N0_9ACTN|nr:class I SAM-dependent methyltransferase [Actinomadura craniellae]RAY12596.1 class I SAM-dependent methyltransferase [Actinomadura craniellae]